MEAEWYIAQNGKQRGPVPADQLKKLFAAGQLKPEDLVWKEGMSEWVAAGSLRWLSTAPAKRPELPAAPAAEPQPEKPAPARPAKKKKAKEKPMSPVKRGAVFVGAFVALTVAVGVGVWLWLRSPWTGELTFLPDDTQMFLSINGPALRASPAYQDGMAAASDLLPTAQREFLDATGVPLEGVKRLTVGGEWQGEGQFLTVLTTTGPVTAADVRAAKKSKAVFTESKIGKYLIYQSADEGFCVAYKATVVYGKPDVLRKVLRRDGAPPLPGGLHDALAQVKPAKPVVFAADMREEPGRPSLWAKLTPNQIPPPTARPLWVFAQVDGASAFDLDATFVCRDGKGATGFKLKCTALLSILKKNEGLAKDIRAAFDALVVKENGKQVVTHGSIEPLALLGPLVRVRDGRKQLTALLQPFVNNPVGGVASAVPGGQGMPIPFGAPGDKTPREWIAELRGDDPGRVQEARKALIRFGKWSVPELTAVLRDSEAKGRPAVAAMLGELGALAESATADLVLTLKAEDEALRTASVEALGKIGARGAYDAMLPALDDISPAVRQAAAQALEKLGPPTIAEVGALGEALQKHGPASRAYAVTALEHIGAMTDTSNLLIVALKDKDAAVRKPAAEALGKFGRGAGSAAVPALREALRDSDGGVRQAALDAIQAMGSPPPSALADLRAALKENTAEARRYGAFGLGRLSADARDAVPDLAATLRDTDAGVRAAACAALGRIGAPAKSAAAGIAQALHDPIRSVRLQAGQALGKIGHADGSVAALIEALKEDDDGVSRAADEALKKLSPVDKADLPPLLAALKSDKIKLRLYAAGELVNLGPDAKGAVPGLIAALADRDIELRKRAALALAAIGPDAKSAVDPLTRMLKEGGDPEQRKCAAQALGAIGPEAKSAIPALSKALSDRDAGVRRASAAAMAKLGSAGKAAVPALVLALTDRDIQDDVVGALAKIGKEAVPGLTDALTDRNATMRLGAAAALGEIGPDAKSAIGRLAQLFANDRNRDVRQAAGLALKKIQRKK